MPSFSLFDTGPQVLLDDASGRIVHVPDVVPGETARAWFTQLLDGIAWRGGRRMMYEREVDVPRLRAHFELADPALPPPVREALAVVRAVVDAPFTSVGLNLYRDEHDSVAPHNDKLEDLVRGHPIALLSLGATREMVIRAKHPPRRAMHLDLAAGSLLLMDYTSQFHYDHGIPKQRAPMGPRISLAFRVRPASQGAGPSPVGNAPR
ncbi:MAG TPA: alpha-ketoglutarate-dependent dioxygenase AlkB [Frateuria sp.]|uniref:alpha-ketoglutarate-dependent dioxygenase AlkB n=1 Tax=Frateuria sp. TaxID=2211372 RepID=UPI002D7EF289|nr:alpha-ketoglutarate-dependent dioxygenase AlkB [Frateuria sp.]HET6806222.1 alpha-ketoglutarate-dependent dioxygenase AlkB [Frateuria sp.]